MVIETATLHAGTCTRSRVITYQLDSSSWNHGAMHVEDRVEYNSGRLHCMQGYAQGVG